MVCTRPRWRARHVRKKHCVMKLNSLDPDFQRYEKPVVSLIFSEWAM
jgi:hypothetical protein